MFMSKNELGDVIETIHKTYFSSFDNENFEPEPMIN